MKLILAFLIALIVCVLPTVCRAQFPEGGPVPLSTVNKDDLHTGFRFGYNATDSLYKYPGEYRADGNWFANGKSSFYGIGDVFVESYLAPGNVFSPSRLWGTFELGGRTTVAKRTYVDAFYRHQSAHNVDSVRYADVRWQFVGLRYRRIMGDVDVWASGSYSTQRVLDNYSTDFEAHSTYRHGYVFGRPVTVDGDVHYVGEIHSYRSGFFDYDIEPSVGLNKTVSVYVSYGMLHDENTPDGKTSVPFIVGAEVAL